MPDQPETGAEESSPQNAESRVPVVDGQRLLGVVPGKPVAGERKEPEEQDLVMVWPHLLVRHAVAALVILLVVTLFSENGRQRDAAMEVMRVETLAGSTQKRSCISFLKPA